MPQLFPGVIREELGTLSSTSILNPTYTSVGSDSLGANISTTLTVSNPGCGIISTDGLFTINQKPHATIASGSPITICAGGTASIPITFIGAKPFTGLGIFNGVSTTNLGTIPSLNYAALVSPSANTNYILALSNIFKDSNNCVVQFQVIEQLSFLLALLLLLV